MLLLLKSVEKISMKLVHCIHNNVIGHPSKLKGKLT